MDPLGYFLGHPFTCDKHSDQGPLLHACADFSHSLNLGLDISPEAQMHNSV